MKIVSRCVLAVLAVVMVLVIAGGVYLGVMYINNDIGLTEQAMMEQAFSEPEGNGFEKYIEGGQIGDTMAVFHCWKVDDPTEFDSKIYIRRNGALGWFFRFAGSSLTEQERYVAKYSIDANGEYALISMNSMNVASIEIDKGYETETIHVKDSQPFAFIMKHSWIVTLYDVEGNVVEPMERNI